jgi:hypothetical protein
VAWPSKYPFEPIAKPSKGIPPLTLIDPIDRIKLNARVCNPIGRHTIIGLNVSRPDPPCDAKGCSLPIYKHSLLARNNQVAVWGDFHNCHSELSCKALASPNFAAPIRITIKVQ